jgi:two-component system, cell cycle sensor histidine kinase and response regulator CckA
LVPAIDRELREAEVRAARRTAEEALRQSEEQLRQAQKLEAVGRLAGGVAHDFNNILTAIAGYSDLAARELTVGQRAHEHVVEIQKATERAAALTGQLLAFSRKQALQPKIIDLNAVVTNLDKMLRRLIGEHIEFKTVLERSLPPVKADPGQIEQVIMNLTVNSRDAMPNGGRLTVHTSRVRMADTVAPRALALPATDFVMLAVTDTGTGMTEEIKTRIFEPFFTTKEPGKGTGLGLAMCYGIVQQSGGHISVESEPGRGTTFRIYLPVTSEALPLIAAEPVRETPVATRGQTILLAEDEDVVRELTSYLLREQGYNVLASSDGEAALAQANQYEGNIDLLLTDAIMPRMGGKELAENLRRRRSDLRVLLASGYSADVLGAPMPGGGPLEFLQKPFTPAALLAKVQHVLS